MFDAAEAPPGLPRTVSFEQARAERGPIAAIEGWMGKRAARLGWRITAPLPVTPVFDLIAKHGDVSVPEMWEVFNMGVGFVCVVPAERADAKTRTLS